jgi:hypothetical protein
MMISWRSKHVGVILSVLVCDIWFNVLLQTSALIGPLYIVNWNARWNSENLKSIFVSGFPINYLYLLAIYMFCVLSTYSFKSSGFCRWYLPFEIIRRFDVVHRPCLTLSSLLYVRPGLTLRNSTFCPHNVYMCFLWISERTEIISLHNSNRFIFYNRDGACLLRDTIWMFECNSG